MRHIIMIMLLVAWLPTAVRGQEQLYERFASRSDLAVARVEGLRLDETAKVDVVLVVADNADAWRTLMAELGVEVADGVSSWLGDVKQPERRTRWNGGPCCRVVVWHERHTVGFYHINDEAQYDALIDYQLNRQSSDTREKTTGGK